MATRLAYFPELLVGIRKSSTDAMLNAGTVTFYEAGTTTLKAVYNDAGGTSAADNPKTLDAYGSARVYGEGVYKLVIKDSAGNTIWTWDNYKLRYYNVDVSSKSANYEATTSNDLILVDTSGGDVTITLPQASTATIPLYIKKISADANSVIVAAYAGDLVDGAASATFSSQNQVGSYYSNGSNNWYGAQNTSNANTIGGYSASQTPTASTVVVSQSGSAYIHDGWVDWSTKAGNGLAWTASDPTSGVLSVNVDDSTIEINTDTLRVKDSGIVTAKIADANVTTVKIADDNVTMAKIENYTASSSGYKVNEHNLFSQTLAGYHRTTQETSYTKILEYKCPVGGTLWSRFGLYVDAGTGYGRIYVNGSASGAEQSTSSVTEVSKTDTSITVAAGDLIQLYLKINSGANSVYVRNWTLRSSTAGGIIMALNTDAL